MSMPSARMSKALTAWTELNSHQRALLAVIYELDQQAGEARLKAAALREFRHAPARKRRPPDACSAPASTLDM